MIAADTNKDERILFIYLALLILSVILTIIIFLSRTTGFSLLNIFSANASIVEARASITKLGFDPVTILVKEGDQITWVNNDDQPHQIASGSHPVHEVFLGIKGFESPVLQTKESFTFEAERTGSYTYHDENDPQGIQGKIIVQ